MSVRLGSQARLTAISPPSPPLDTRRIPILKKQQKSKRKTPRKQSQDFRYPVLEICMIENLGWRHSRELIPMWSLRCCYPAIQPPPGLTRRCALLASSPHPIRSAIIRHVPDSDH